MHTDDNNAIRYLMKEMDPSEEMEFENLIREDENLLIEVESLRAVKQKLSGLPLKNPPKNLTNNIADEVKQLQLKESKNNRYISSILKKSIAAALLAIALSGGYYYYSGIMESSVPASTVSTENVEPWVDRNEVIRFSGIQQFTSPSSAIQNDFTKSYEKLQLVNDPQVRTGENSGILLTGSPQ